MTDSNRTFRKTRTGIVTSDSREKTVTCIYRNSISTS
jgi:ribosomal protein S17